MYCLKSLVYARLKGLRGAGGILRRENIKLIRSIQWIFLNIYEIHTLIIYVNKICFFYTLSCSLKMFLNQCFVLARKVTLKEAFQIIKIKKNYFLRTESSLYFSLTSERYGSKMLQKIIKTHFLFQAIKLLLCLFSY